MPLPTVWPEHPEVSGVIGYHDCSQSSALMCLIYAGFTAFPLGAYTVAERNALDAADDRPDNTGATFDGSIRTAGWLEKQIANRYGVTLRKLPDSTEATFRKFLSTPGYAFIVQGTMGNLPVGHPLRRWQPEFSGAHAVCVISGTRPRWLDPLGPLHFAGDLTDLDTVLRFAWDGNQYSRYLKKDELLSLPDTAAEDDVTLIIEIEKYATPRVVRCLTGGTIRAYLPPDHTVVRQATLTRPSWFHASGYAKVTGWSTDPKNPVWDYWVAGDGFFGPDNNNGKSLFVAVSAYTKADPLPPAPSTTDYQAAIDAATKPLEERITAVTNALTVANGRLTQHAAIGGPVPVPK